MTEHEGYTLINGEEADTYTEQVMTLLDEIDPLSDELLGSMTDEETLREFELWQRKLWWCAELGCTISRHGLDGYIETKGDIKITELMRMFNKARYAWGLQEMVAANSDKNKTREKLASNWLKYVKKTQSSNNIASVVRLWKLCHQIEVNELNLNPEHLGTPEGVIDMVTNSLVFNDIRADIDNLIYLGDSSADHGSNHGAEDEMITKRTRMLLV